MLERTTMQDDPAPTFFAPTPAHEVWTAILDRTTCLSWWPGSRPALGSPKILAPEPSLQSPETVTWIETWAGSRGAYH